MRSAPLRPVAAVFLLGALIAAFVPRASAASLTEEDAKRLVDASLTQEQDQIFVGQFAIRGGGPPFLGQSDPRHGVISEDQYRYFRLLEQTKLLRVRGGPSGAKEPFNWGGFMGQMTAGITGQVVVEATPQSAQYLRHNPGGRDYLSFPKGAFATERIVENAEQRIGATEYRIVSGLGTRTFGDAFGQMLRLWDGAAMTPHLKFRFLFEYDPFASGWKQVAYDVAYANRAFNSDEIGKALRKSAGAQRQ
jgi:hypothetical protein